MDIHFQSIVSINTLKFLHMRFTCHLRNSATMAAQAIFHNLGTSLNASYAKPASACDLANPPPSHHHTNNNQQTRLLWQSRSENTPSSAISLRLMNVVYINLILPLRANPALACSISVISIWEMSYDLNWNVCIVYYSDYHIH